MIAGFISAAALTIATGQMKGLLGLSITEKSGYPGILGSWWDICANIRKARINDTILGVTCIVILLSLRVRAYFHDPVCRKNAINLQKNAIVWRKKTAGDLSKQLKKILPVFCFLQFDCNFSAVLFRLAIRWCRSFLLFYA